MKFLKKITLLSAALIACFSFSAALTACEKNKEQDSQSQIVSSSDLTDSVSESTDNSSESTSDSEEEILDYVYRVSVRCGTYAFKGVQIELYDGDEQVASKKSTSSGYAIFTDEDVTPGKYTVKATNLPNGYATEESATFTTVDVPLTEVLIPITSQGVMENTMPEETTYALGDVMYDFTITDSDGKQHVLSEILQEKQLVMLNLWATWCGPCKAEFPVMNSAYLEYQDRIELLALSISDGKQAVANFKSTNRLSFPMVSSESQFNNGVTKAFQGTGVPITYIIDRYGVVVYRHSGSMTAVSDFTNLFDKFLGDDYTTKIQGSDNGDSTTPNEGNTDVYIEPTKEIVAATPTLSEVKEALKGDSGFEYRWQSNDPELHDPYNWPWLINEDTNGSYIYSSNAGVHPSYSTLYVDFEAKAGQALLFDYIASSEEEYDVLYVLIDGTPIHQLSGALNPDWQTCYAYVFKEHEEGAHELTLMYLKNESQSVGDDMFKVKNLRFIDVNDIDPNANANIFRYAATVLSTDENATTKYQNYATVVLNETDGYYHVDTKDGPLLFANIWFVSDWNETSLWMLAYNQYCIMDGISLLPIIEEYAWQGNNNLTNYGYVPVTQELRETLDLVMQYVDYGKKWDGEYHENEWLELCCYYEHYGENTPQFADPMETISFHAAKQVYEGTNEVIVQFAMNPRGFKYKFIPETSGVYHIYSTGEKSTACFLVADDTETMLGTYEGYITPTFEKNENGKLVINENFNFYYYMNAGETYYLLCTTFLDEPTSYGLEIHYTGESYNHLTNAAYGFHTYNEATGVEYLPNRIDYVYADPTQTYTYATGEVTVGDGYYHHVYDDGSLGSIIYLRTDVPSAVFNQDSLYDICLEALEYETENRFFYINGVDYTDALMQYCIQASRQEGELRGFIAVDENLLTLLRTITMDSSYEGMKDSWLMLCYYYKPITK